MKRIIFSLWFMVYGLWPFVYAQDETLTLLTYYPAPYGIYQNLNVMGNVGIGTTNPQTKLHLLVPDNGGIRIQAGESGWGAARLEFYSDPIGNTNEWRPGYITSADSGNFTGRLDFYTNGTGSGQKTGSVLGMSIKNGNVGIGTNNPTERLTVNGNIRGTGDMTISTPSGAIIIDAGSGTTILKNNLNIDDASGNTNCLIGTDGRGLFKGNLAVGDNPPMPGTEGLGVERDIRVNGEAYKSTAHWNISSDIRLKKNIQPIENALDKILELKGITHQWIEPQKHGNMTGTYMGFIGQDVEKVFPEWIITDNDSYKMLNIIGFEALAAEAIRELKKENDTLREQVSKLETRIKILEEKSR